LKVIAEINEKVLLIIESDSSRAELVQALPAARDSNLDVLDQLWKLGLDLSKEHST